MSKAMLKLKIEWKEIIILEDLFKIQIMDPNLDQF